MGVFKALESFFKVLHIATHAFQTIDIILQTKEFHCKTTGNVIEGEILKVAKLRTDRSDTYECVADNGIGDSLRKTINVFFSGKHHYNLRGI